MSPTAELQLSRLPGVQGVKSGQGCCACVAIAMPWLWLDLLHD